MSQTDVGIQFQVFVLLKGEEKRKDGEEQRKKEKKKKKEKKRVLKQQQLAEDIIILLTLPIKPSELKIYRKCFSKNHQEKTVNSYVVRILQMKGVDRIKRTGWIIKLSRH